MIKEWLIWVLIFGISGYSFLLFLHSSLTVDRFQNGAGSTTSAAGVDDDDDPSLVLGDDDKHLFWFIQLSDIHVSKFWDAGRHKDLSRFCRDWLPVIRPKVVLVTGDLTDAKDVDFVGSEQYVEEWKEYYKAVAESPAIKTGATEWLDLRGNHDTFDVPSIPHPRNFYSEFSIRGRRHPASYVYHVSLDGAKYSFLAADFAPSPGPKRPYNFFGVLDDAKVREIEALEAETKDSNATIFFGHYPSSTVVSTGRRDVTSIMSTGLAYLSGHLHTAYGWVPAMHAIQDSGVLELEGGDWKDGRRVRLLALDHGILSFTDQSFASDFPVVVMTNPKHALYLAPTKEPLHRIFRSTHVRILAFSDAEITRVTVYIDNAFLGTATRASKDGPLYVLPWNPRSYSPGTHSIEVRVFDAKGRTRTLKQPFSTHGHSHLEFRFVNRLLLLSDISIVLKTLFALFFSTLFCPLLLFRFRPSAFASFHSITRAGPSLSCSSASCPPTLPAAPCSSPSCTSTCSSCTSPSCSPSSSCPPTLPRAPFPLNIPLRLLALIFRSLLFISFFNWAFFAVLGILIYMVIGPWFVAYLTREQLGFVFLHGIYVGGQYLPMNTTYGTGIGYLLFFLLPFCVHLGRCLEKRFQNLVRKTCSSSYSSATSCPRAVLNFLLSHWFALFFFSFHFHSIFIRVSPYGVWQKALAPVRTWFFFVAAALSCGAKAAPISAFRQPALEYGLVEGRSDARGVNGGPCHRKCVD